MKRLPRTVTAFAVLLTMSVPGAFAQYVFSEETAVNIIPEIARILPNDVPGRMGGQGLGGLCHQEMEATLRSLDDSTSELPSSGGYSYGPLSAKDGNPNTGWSEGVDGPGHGEVLQVLLALPRTDRGDVITRQYLYVFPGWGSDPGWERNNRVARAIIRVYGVVNSSWGDCSWSFSQTYEEHHVTFADSPSYFGFPVGRYTDGSFAPLTGGLPTYLLVEIEVVDTFPGSRWDDTVIADVFLAWKTESGP